MLKPGRQDDGTRGRDVQAIATRRATRRFTVDDLYRMDAAGIFGVEERVELVDGEIYVMPVPGSPHATCVRRFNFLLTRRLGERAIVSVQNPVRLSEHDLPMPDIAVLRYRDDFYAEEHPSPEDILLIVAVSDSSAVFDRGHKLRRYAAAGVPHYVVAQVRTRTIEDYREPAGGGYRRHRTLRDDARLSLLSFPDVSIAVHEVFPQR